MIMLAMIIMVIMIMKERQISVTNMKHDYNAKCITSFQIKQ